MKNAEHITEQDLVAYCFGDAADSAAIADHLAQCSRCAGDLAKLQAVLNAVNDHTWPVPARESYGEQVWASVKPRLATGDGWRAGIADFFRPRALAIAGGLMALVIVAFIAGRFSRQPAPVAPVTAQNDATAKQRVVLVAVGDHLERSQMMLVELANSEAGKHGIDISAEQERARDLLDANRLYRQSAKRAGDPAVSAVLDELERVLVEISNSPTELSPQRLEELQQQIRAQGILFKVRVIGSKVRSTERERTQPQTNAPSASNVLRRS